MVIIHIHARIYGRLVALILNMFLIENMSCSLFGCICTVFILIGAAVFIYAYLFNRRSARSEGDEVRNIRRNARRKRLTGGGIKDSIVAIFMAMLQSEDRTLIELFYLVTNYDDTTLKDLLNHIITLGETDENPDETDEDLLNLFVTPDGTDIISVYIREIVNNDRLTISDGVLCVIEEDGTKEEFIENMRNRLYVQIETAYEYIVSCVPAYAYLIGDLTVIDLEDRLQMFCFPLLLDTTCTTFTEAEIQQALEVYLAEAKKLGYVIDGD